jgi:putative nucleotidyltransferase with HDIG domain
LNHLYDVLYSPDTDIGDIADAMKSDASLTARVMRVANSAYSSSVSQIDNLNDAIVRIGLLTTIHVVTATEFKSMFFRIPLPFGDIVDLWKHNLLVASLAEAYANMTKAVNPNIYFIAGLLHDIGRLLLMNHSPNKYFDIMKDVRFNNADMRASERDAFGLSHDVAGGYLLTHWHMPDEAINAALNHHEPLNDTDRVSNAVIKCNLIAHALSDNNGPYLPSIDSVPVEKLIALAAGKFELMKKISGIT